MNLWNETRRNPPKSGNMELSTNDLRMRELENYPPSQRNRQQNYQQSQYNQQNYQQSQYNQQNSQSNSHQSNNHNMISQYSTTPVQNFGNTVKTFPMPGKDFGLNISQNTSSDIQPEPNIQSTPNLNSSSLEGTDIKIIDQNKQSYNINNHSDLVKLLNSYWYHYSNPNNGQMQLKIVFKETCFRMTVDNHHQLKTVSDYYINPTNTDISQINTNISLEGTEVKIVDFNSGEERIVSDLTNLKRMTDASKEYYGKRPKIKPDMEFYFVKTKLLNTVTDRNGFDIILKYYLDPITTKIEISVPRNMFIPEPEDDIETSGETKVNTVFYDKSDAKIINKEQDLEVNKKTIFNSQINSNIEVGTVFDADPNCQNEDSDEAPDQDENLSTSKYEEANDLIKKLQNIQRQIEKDGGIDVNEDKPKPEKMSQFQRLRLAIKAEEKMERETTPESRAKAAHERLIASANKDRSKSSKNIILNTLALEPYKDVKKRMDYLKNKVIYPDGSIRIINPELESIPNPIIQSSSEINPELESIPNPIIQSSSEINPASDPIPNPIIPSSSEINPESDPIPNPIIPSSSEINPESDPIPIPTGESGTFIPKIIYSNNSDSISTIGSTLIIKNNKGRSIFSNNKVTDEKNMEEKVGNLSTIVDDHYGEVNSYGLPIDTSQYRERETDFDPNYRDPKMAEEEMEDTFTGLYLTEEEEEKKMIDYYGVGSGSIDFDESEDESETTRTDIDSDDDIITDSVEKLDMKVKKYHVYQPSHFNDEACEETTITNTNIVNEIDTEVINSDSIPKVSRKIVPQVVNNIEKYSYLENLSFSIPLSLIGSELDPEAIYCYCVSSSIQNYSGKTIYATNVFGKITAIKPTGNSASGEIVVKYGSYLTTAAENINKHRTKSDGELRIMEISPVVITNKKFVPITPINTVISFDENTLKTSEVKNILDNYKKQIDERRYFNTFSKYGFALFIDDPDNTYEDGLWTTINGKVIKLATTDSSNSGCTLAVYNKNNILMSETVLFKDIKDKAYFDIKCLDLEFRIFTKAKDATEYTKGDNPTAATSTRDYQASINEKDNVIEKLEITIGELNNTIKKLNKNKKVDKDVELANIKLIAAQEKDERAIKLAEINRKAAQEEGERLRIVADKIAVENALKVAAVIAKDKRDEAATIAKEKREEAVIIAKEKRDADAKAIKIAVAIAKEKRDEEIAIAKDKRDAESASIKIAAMIAKEKRDAEAAKIKAKDDAANGKINSKTAESKNTGTKWQTISKCVVGFFTVVAATVAAVIKFT